MRAKHSILPILGVFCLALVLATLFSSRPPLAAQGTRAASATAAQSVDFHEEVIAQIPEGTEVKEIIEAGDHVAWIQKKGNLWTVVLDGQTQGPAFERIDFLRFSSDGAHLAFFGKRDGKWILIMESQERSPSYTYHTDVAFQPKGNSFAYSACTEKKKCQLVVDGKQTGAEYEDISYPQYSDDGKRLAYFGKKHGKKWKWVAVVDGKETGPDLSGVDFREWGFSAHTNRFYAAVLPVGANWTYLVDDATGPSFVTLSPIAFSAGDEHFVYGGATSRGGLKKQGVTGTVVLDGKPGSSYEGSGMQGAWTLLLNYSQVMVSGTRDLDAGFQGISNPKFNSSGKLVYALRNGKGDIVVMNGEQTGPSFDDVVSDLVLTEDEQHIAYVARRGTDFVEVRDNQPGKTFPIDAKFGGIGWMWLSTDASHLAYEIIRGGNTYNSGGTARARRTVIIDGQPGTEYNAFDISLVRFTKNGKHYFYRVIGADGSRTLMVIDGKESKLYDFQTLGRFSSDEKSVAFVAKDSSRIVRVTASLPE
ncbi:MAG TPA: hypothetical protein VGR81_06180 [Candidatus Acidoferrales bacterium]|nr:hypothetical protein [Candidatus Acidoferrales bacterium]